MHIYELLYRKSDVGLYKDTLITANQSTLFCCSSFIFVERYGIYRKETIKIEMIISCCWKVIHGKKHMRFAYGKKYDDDLTMTRLLLLSCNLLALLPSLACLSIRLYTITPVEAPWECLISCVL